MLNTFSNYLLPVTDDMNDNAKDFQKMFGAMFEVLRHHITSPETDNVQKTLANNALNELLSTSLVVMHALERLPELVAPEEQSEEEETD